MARRVRGSRFEHARSNRIPVWFTSRLDETAAGGGGSTLLSVLNAAALALRPFTIIRTRLWIHIHSDQAAAGEVAQGAYGKIVVQEEAVDAGVGSVPTPISEADASFFVYEPFVNEFTFVSAVGFQERGGTNIVVDSKAMRKVGISEDLVSVIELATAPGVLISIEGRILVKLH